jgi:hypothetical protein
MSINLFEQLEHPDGSLDPALLAHSTNGSLRTLLDKAKEISDAIRYEMYRRGMISAEEYTSLKARETL